MHSAPCDGECERQISAHFQAEVDSGAIIDQLVCRVMEGDTEDSLMARVKALEHDLYPKCVDRLCASLPAREYDGN